jgi:hypothetical protein
MEFFHFIFCETGSSKMRYLKGYKTCFAQEAKRNFCNYKKKCIRQNNVEITYIKINSEEKCQESEKSGKPINHWIKICFENPSLPLWQMCWEGKRKFCKFCRTAEDYQLFKSSDRYRILLSNCISACRRTINECVCVKVWLP